MIRLRVKIWGQLDWGSSAREVVILELGDVGLGCCTRWVRRWILPVAARRLAIVRQESCSARLTHSGQALAVETTEKFIGAEWEAQGRQNPWVVGGPHALQGLLGVVWVLFSECLERIRKIQISFTQISTINKKYKMKSFELVKLIKSLTKGISSLLCLGSSY